MTATDGELYFTLHFLLSCCRLKSKLSINSPKFMFLFYLCSSNFCRLSLSKIEYCQYGRLRWLHRRIDAAKISKLLGIFIQHILDRIINKKTQ